MAVTVSSGRCGRLVVGCIPLQGGRMGGVCSGVRSFGRRAEVASDEFKGVFFDVYFFSCPHTEAAEQGDGRAPALDGVLEQECQDGCREQQPFPVDVPMKGRDEAFSSRRRSKSHSWSSSSSRSVMSAFDRTA